MADITQTQVASTVGNEIEKALEQHYTEEDREYGSAEYKCTECDTDDINASTCEARDR